MDNPKSFLVVDDSRVARMMSIGVIKGLYPDIKIIEADSGENALKTLEKETPDIILMDINMGGLDGIETSAMIRTANPEQVIAVCSANIQSGIQDQVKELGITFIAKPILADKIENFVKSLKWENFNKAREVYEQWLDKYGERRSHWVF